MSECAAKYEPHRKQRFTGGRVAELVIEALGRELEWWQDCELSSRERTTGRAQVAGPGASDMICWLPLAQVAAIVTALIRQVGPLRTSSKR